MGNVTNFKLPSYVYNNVTELKKNTTTSDTIGMYAFSEKNHDNPLLFKGETSLHSACIIGTYI